MNQNNLEADMAASERSHPGKIRRRILIGLTVALVVVALAVIGLAVLPFGIRWQAQRWLRGHGQGNARIANVDFNPFTGRIAVDSLLGGEADYGRLDLGRADLELDYLALLNQRVSLGDVAVEDVTLDVQRDAQGGLQIGSLSFGRGEGDGGPGDGQSWEVEYGTVDIRNVTVRYADPLVTVDVLVKHLHADPFASWEEGTAARFTAELEVNGRPVAFAATIVPRGPEPQFRAALEIDALPLDWLAALLSQHGVEELGGVLSADTTFRGSLDLASLTGFCYQRGNLHVDGLQGRLPQAHLRGATLNWDGRVRVAGLLFGPQLQIDGALDLGNVDVALPSAGLAVAHKRLTWNGDATFALVGLPGSIQGNLSAEGVTVGVLDGAAPLAELAALELDQVTVGLSGTTEQVEVRAEGPVKASGIRVYVSPAGLDITQSALNWDGTFEYGTTAPGTMKLHGNLGTQGLTVDDANGAWGSVKLANLQFSDHTVDVTPVESQRQITVGGGLNLQDLSVQLAAAGLDIAQSGLTWDGTFEYGTTAPGTMKLHGDLGTQGLTVDDANGAWGSVKLANLQFSDHTVDVTPVESQRQISVGGGLNLQDFSARLVAAGIDIAQKQLDWQGNVLYGPDKTNGLAVDGELTIADLEMLLASAGIGVTQAQFSWQGGALIGPEEDGGFSAQGQLHGAGLAVDDLQEKSSLARAATWRIQDVRFDGTSQAAASQIQLDGLQALQRPVKEERKSAPYAATVDTLALDKVQASRSGLAADALTVSGLDAYLVITPEGELELADLIPKGKQSPETVEAQESEEDSGFTVRFGQVELRGDNRLAFRDESAVSPVALVLEPFSLTVAPLDLAAPDAVSTVAFRGKSGEYSSIAVDGTMAPFTTPPTMELTGTFESVDLPPFTPYAERASGYRLNSGTLDGDVRFRLDAGILDSNAKLLAKGFTIERVAEGLDDQITEQLGLSLRSALGLLRNDKDEIQLTIPVTGDLANLNVGLGDAIRQATLNGTTRALKAGAVAYFAPVGAVVVAGKMAKQATAVRFEPVAFEPGDGELSSGAKGLLDEMARLLRDRKGIKLTLTGVAASADIPQRKLEGPLRKTLSMVPPLVPSIGRKPDADEPEQAEESGTETSEQDASREPLLELATSRVNAVKDYLVSTGGLEPGRLLVTLPTIDEKPDAQPRVEVGL
jgi:Domain of Unknown Function (DUF748)